MNEALVQALTQAVSEQLGMASMPRALLIGRAPEMACGYRFVTEPPYDAVVIGSLSVGELLHFTCEAALKALLEGKPVLLWKAGMPHYGYRNTANRALYARCLRAERELEQLGIRPLGAAESSVLVTAQTARELHRQGRSAPPGAILTPLARDILEEKS